MNELPDCKTRHPLYTCQRVGVIGGGFSGALVLANLVEQADRPLTVDFFEPATWGTGVAYSTTDRAHLLNVRAERMGALAGQPDHFYRWLQGPEGQTATMLLDLETPVTGESYVPRLLYGLYLRQLFQTTLLKAHAKGITVHLHHTRVTDVEPNRLIGRGLILRTEQPNALEPIPVDTLVLATGNCPYRPAFLPQAGEPGSEAVVDGWSMHKQDFFPQQLAALDPTREIVIIGTGLTMVDAVLTLQAHGYRGTITAISRHGWLPAPHAHGKAYGAWAWTRDPESAPRTALGLLQGLRAEIKQAATLGYDWRSVIDSLRPVTQTLWKRLPDGEKAKFLRRLFTLWNIHRHRMAPSIHTALTSLQQAGRLRIVAGTVTQVAPNATGLTVTYRTHRGSPAVSEAALVINCTGPRYTCTEEQGLLANLHWRGLINVGPLGIGIEVDANGSATGTLPGVIYPLGSLLVGELLECTAVPELREQAKVVAEQVVGHVMLPEQGQHAPARQSERELALAA